jgi:exoribonuclease-2
MSKAYFSQDSLVLYKNRPARIARVAQKKIVIEVEGGKLISVRFKDVVPLHPGPVGDLAALRSMKGELLIAWELLAGEITNLPELSELIYGEYSPSSAWATWQLVADGLYFKGDPEQISVQSQEAVEQAKRLRQQRFDELKAWQDFVERMRSGRYFKDDAIYLEDIAQLALGNRESSRVLRELGKDESPEAAHSLLLEVGYWADDVNPYPSRLELSLESPALTVETLDSEDRLDLTHLPAFAIDDSGTADPDDALSIEDGRLWVHIADVTAIVPPNSPADLEARSRGANLYLPEGTVTMLPGQATSSMALGLTEVSPAFSFGLDFSNQGEISNLEIAPSWVRVTRTTYDEVESRLDEPFFQKLASIAKRSLKRRMKKGAIEISLPEVKIRVKDALVKILPLPPLESRALVREAMVLTGEAVAQYASANGIPVPYSTQEAPDSDAAQPSTLSQMFALRNSLKPSKRSTQPGSHAGLGLESYVQATSPLRRYLDLVVHQQLRAHLAGSKLLSLEEVTERVGSADAVIGSVRRVERYSNKHWTLVYLQQNPDWSGDGVIVDRRGARSHVLLPEIALETNLYLRKDLDLDQNVRLRIGGVNLAYLEADFRPID